MDQEPKNKSNKQTNELFLDWDDTLFPATELKLLGCLKDNNFTKTDEITEMLDEISDTIIEIIKEAQKRNYNITIITGSGLNWVKMTASYFMPKLVPFLSKIQILYAVVMYEKFAIIQDDPYMTPRKKRILQALYCKTLCFKNKIRYLLHKTFTCYNIIAIGDTNEDVKAIIETGEYIRKSTTKKLLIKSIKFITCPKIVDLYAQLKEFLKLYETIDKKDADMNVCVSLNIVNKENKLIN